MAGTAVAQLRDDEYMPVLEEEEEALCGIWTHTPSLSNDQPWYVHCKYCPLLVRRP